MANLLRRWLLAAFISDDPKLRHWLTKYPNSSLFDLIDEGIL